MKISSTAALAAPLKAATLFRGGLAESIRRTAEYGYDGIELQLKLDQRTEIDFDEIADQCTRNGICVSAYATGSLFVKDGLSLIDDDPDIRRQAVDRLKLYVNAASKTGGKVIIGCVRGNLRDDEEYPEMTNRLARGLDEVLNYAATKNTATVLEAINRYENNYLATAEETVAFIEEFRLDTLGILLDTFHMNMEETDFRQAFEIAAPYLQHVHFADNNRLVPGMGTLDFGKILDDLNAVKYSKWVSLECYVEGNEDLEAEAAVAYLRGLMGRIR